MSTNFGILTNTAMLHGYLLAWHKDTDLVAIPWTESAVRAEDLIEKLFGEGDWKLQGDPAKKLHGRKVWSVFQENSGQGCRLLDVSVMPRIATEEQRLTKRHRLDTRNQAIYDDFVYNDLTRGALSRKYNLSTFHLTGILDQLRQCRYRLDGAKGLIRPVLDPHKRRVKNDHVHEAGYILGYPAKGNDQGPISKLTPVWAYREAQKEADRLNQLTP